MRCRPAKSWPRLVQFTVLDDLSNTLTTPSPHGFDQIFGMPGTTTFRAGSPIASTVPPPRPSHPRGLWAADIQIKTTTQIKHSRNSALVHLVSQTDPSAVIGQQISDALVAHVEQDAALFERTVSQLRATKTRVSDLDVARWLSVLRILCPSKGDADHQAAQRQLAGQLHQLLEAIHARHDERLETAEIDPAHIEGITDACVKHAFSREHGAVPLPYF